MAAKIPPSNMNFDSYLPHVCTIFAEKSVTEEELKKAFFSLKPNKTPGYDNINVNIVKKIYKELKTPLMRIFNLSLSTGIFPDKLKIAKVSPIFKNSEKDLLTNYRPISVLPCFSEILERIMYDRLYSYLTENKILFKKQFGFRSGHSTDHAFYSHSNIKILFKNANDELEKNSQWFKANKLSLNEGKTKFTLFHKLCDKDNLPLQLPNLKINNNEIKRSSSIKFLGVLVDENLTWIDHITLVENKLSKNLGLLHKAKNYLNKKSMVNLYYSFIHSYLNYGNIAWCSTSMTKLKKLYLGKNKLFELFRSLPHSPNHVLNK